MKSAVGLEQDRRFLLWDFPTSKATTKRVKWCKCVFQGREEEEPSTLDEEDREREESKQLLNACFCFSI